jgi:anti-sigma factor RsiW
MNTSPTCRQAILDLLLDYAEGRMAPEEKKVFDEHLARCPECVVFVRTYMATEGALRRVRPEALPSSLVDRVLAYIRAKQSGGS